MQRIAGVNGWPDAEARRRIARMLAASGGSAAEKASSDGVSVTIAGDIFDPAGGARAVLDLYRRRGLEGALKAINGDFGLAIADESEQTLHLARDRFGVQPLYYWSKGEKLAYASRPRSLLALAEVPREINRAYAGLFAGSHYRTFDNDPEASPFAAIRQVPAAHALTWKDGRTSLRRYWALDAERDLDIDEASLAERYRELLVDAVRIRLARSPRPAFTLSGGMDSSSVLACAVRATGKRQHAWSTVYEDPTFDESSDIQSMLDATVERWHPVRVNAPDVHALVAEMVAAHDEPVATATWLAHYVLCREAAAAGFGSLFGGLGGDELNAGEYEHFLYFFADLQARGESGRLEREVRMWAHHHDHPIYRKSAESMRLQLSRVADLHTPGRCLPDRARIDRYADAVDRAFFDVRGFVPVMEAPFTSYLKNRTWQDLSRETVPCCLRAEDRQAAAFGLVNVTPFFDHRLVELMFRVSPLLKYRDGVTKHVLREAMKGVLPEATRTRVKKTGWNAPAHQWFAGKGGEMLRDLVRSQRFRSRGIYRVDEVERLLAEHEDVVAHGLAQENHMMFFWQLLNLACWLDWIDELPRAQ